MVCRARDVCGMVCGMVCGIKWRSGAVVRYVRYVRVSARVCVRVCAHARMCACARTWLGCRTCRTWLNGAGLMAHTMPHTMPHMPHRMGRHGARSAFERRGAAGQVFRCQVSHSGRPCRRRRIF